MNILNLFTKSYGLLCNYRGIPFWALTPFRRFVRYWANKALPLYLRRTSVRDFAPKEGVIISLTSYPARIRIVWQVIKSLKNQTVLPEKIILWLSKRQFPTRDSIPHLLWEQVDTLFEIRMVDDDIRSHKKYYYAMREFPDKAIVTCDDDIYYPKNWLKYLYLSYVSNQDDIHCHRAHRVGLKYGKILPYENWEKQVEEESARYDNFLTGAGGVLYPPKCFSNEVLREDVFLKYAPSADDIWLWVMALVHGKKIRVVKNHYKTLISTNLFRQIFGKTLYSVNKDGQNDIQLNNLMKFYSNNILSKLKG